MPVTISHALSATTPDNPAYEIRPSHWNSNHVATLNAVGSEIIGAFSNDPAVNVSFSTNGGGFVIASANVTAAPSPVNVTGANGSSVNAQTIAFSNANGISLGVSTAANGATVTGSYTVPTQTVQPVAFSALGGSSNFSTLSFSNANGLSFSNNAGQVQASYTVPTVTNSSMTVSDAATSGTLARLAFTNLNGVTLSLSTGAGGSHTIVGSHNALTSQSNQAFSAAGGSSAFQTLSFADTNSVSFTNTNGSIGIASVKLQMFAVSNTTQSSSGTANHTALSFAGAGVASVGVTNGSVVISVPSGGGANFSAGVSTGGNTSGDTGVTGTRLVFAGGNSITVSQGTDANGATITISGATTSQSNQTVGLYGSSQTTGSASSGTLDARSISIIGAGIISVGMHSTSAGGTTTGLLISASQSNQTQSNVQGIIVSNNTFRTGDVSFSNLNGISFGSNGANVVTASYTVPTVTNSSMTVSDAATSGTLARLAFTNLNGVTLSLSTGAGGSHTIVGSHNAITSQTNQTIGFYGSSQTTGSASSGTLDARSVSIIGAGGLSVGMHSTSAGGTTTGLVLSAPGIATTISVVASANVVGTNKRYAPEDHQHAGIFSLGVSTGGNTSGNTTVQAGQVVLAGGNNITLSQATAAGGLATVTISAGAGGGGFTGGMSNIGNTAGTSGTVQSQMLVVGGPNITVSQSINGQSATLSISGNAPGAAAENNWFTLAGDNTAGNTTASGSSLMLSVQGALTISGTNNSQIKISAPATSSLVGTNGISLSTAGSTISIGLSPNYSASFFEPELYGGITSGTQANGTVYFRPFFLNNNLAVYRLQMLGSISSQVSTTMSNSASVSSQTSTSGTGAWGLSGTALLFSRVSTGTNANSSQIISFFSNTYTMSAGHSMSVTWSTNASTVTASWTTSGRFGWISSIDSVGNVTSSSTGTSGSNTWSSTSTNQNSRSSSFTMSFLSQHMSGIRPIMVGFGTTLTPGEYWLAHIQSTSSGSGTYSLQQQCIPSSVGMVNYSTQTTNYAEYGISTTIASSNLKWGIGSYSASSQTTTTIPISQISNMSNSSLFFNMEAHVH